MAMTVSLGLLLGAGAQAEELVKFEIVGGARIDKSLTGQPGDPVNGRKLAIDRKLGNDGFERVLKKFQGKTMLNAQQVEDIVAYLMTLKSN